MELPRRKFIRLASAVAAVSGFPRLGSALDYPTKPVRLIVPFPPGGPTDIGARLIGQFLSERLGQQIVIENRAGAGGNIGTEAAVKALPDGYTLLQVTVANAINNSLYEKLNFNIVQDIAPVASVYRQPLVLEVHPAIPVTTVPEFIAYAKANPGKINMASGGNGTPQHLAGELFKMMAGVEMVHVPYSGAAPALTDMIGGQVQVMFDTMNSSIEHIRAGRLRPLAVTTASRTPTLPDVPIIANFVPGYEVSSWSGVGAPRNTPAEIIDKLNMEINAGLADSRMKARFAEMGVTALPGSPADFQKLIADDTEKWSKVVKFSGAKAE
jgi:tripartite-type tricarboxylate transporter receptor subunit TctC